MSAVLIHVLASGLRVPTTSSARACVKMCEPPKYYTEKEQRTLDSITAALGRVGGGGLLGVAGGGLVHEAVNEYSALGTPAFGTIDPLLNLFDLGLGGLCGLLLGVLWACEAALLGSGAIRSYIIGAMSSLVEAEDDARAGDRALRTIREGFQTLAVRGDWPLRVAFLLTGLQDEPAVARLVEEAETAAQRESDAAARPFSELIAIVFESTLEARLGDARFLILGLGLVVVGSVDGAVWLFGSAVSSILGGGS